MAMFRRGYTLFAIKGRAKPVFPMACYTLYTCVVVGWLMIRVPGFDTGPGGYTRCVSGCKVGCRGGLCGVVIGGWRRNIQRTYVESVCGVLSTHKGIPLGLGSEQSDLGN